MLQSVKAAMQFPREVGTGWIHWMNWISKETSLTGKHTCDCITSINTYIDQQIRDSSNWYWLWREAGEGCPIIIDIQFSTRLASNHDRVVTFRNMLQVGALTESYRIQCHGIQYNVMRIKYKAMYVRELILSKYVAELINSNWLLDVSGTIAFINHIQFLLTDSAVCIYSSRSVR